MKVVKQFTLNNFSVLPSFLQALEMLGGMDDGEQIALWTDEGVRISERPQICSGCSRPLASNGSYAKSPETLKRFGITVRVQQMYCRRCEVSGKIQHSFIDTVLAKTNQVITNLCVLLTEAGVSKERSSTIFRDGLGISITGHTVANRVQTEIDGVEIAAPLPLKDVAHYDEQFFKENGIQKARICILEPGQPIPLYDAIHENATRETIRFVLDEIKEKYPNIRGFVMDMEPRYPKLFKEVFGPDILLLWCLFHLNKLIFKEMRAAVTIGRRVFWTLNDVANLYRVLGIFYNREHELEWLIAARKRFDDFKDYRQKYGDKRKDIDNDIREHERRIVKEFWRFVRHLKLARRRAGENLRLRPKKDALALLKKWHEQKTCFPKVLASRLDYIVKHKDKFTAALGEPDLPHTNNYQEAYFSSTCQQKKKKDARSPLTFPLRLKLGHLRKMGMLVLAPISLFTLLQHWHILFSLLGAPP